MERAIPHLPADDLRVAKEFYVTKLGFHVAFEAFPSGSSAPRPTHEEGPLDATNLLSSDVSVIASCLRQGVDPNSFVGGDADDVRALAVHAFEGRTEVVRLLLERGANPNLGRDSTGETPLHHAVCGTIEIEVVRALLQAGADPNARCEIGIASDNFMRDVRVRGEAPLHRAAAYADRPVIQALLDAGARLETRDANGDSALSWASLHRRDRGLLELLCFGPHRV